MRQVAKQLWGFGADITALTNRASGADQPRVYYGGARAGSSGGPMVKVSLLQREFPEMRRGFNLMYMLSGSLHLSGLTLGALRARGIPMVLNQNGVFFPAWYPQGWERQNARQARALNHADHVFFQSEFCRRMADQFLGTTGGLGEILYNGVDTTQFTPAPHHDGLAGRPLRLLVTGKIVPSTASRLLNTIEGLAAVRAAGIEAVLAVWAAIDPVTLAQAQSLIERKNLAAAVTLHGPYPHARAPDIYRQADIYVMTKPNDSCPNAVLEALASGLPVLYSHSGGVPELVGETAGVGMPVAEDFTRDVMPDSAAFVGGVARIMAGYAEMRMAARHRAVEKFELAHWLSRHRAVFTKLLQERT